MSPAAIGKGGKNVSAIVNKIGIGIDIKPRSDLDRQHAQPTVKTEGGDLPWWRDKIQTDKKQLVIIAPEQSGKIRRGCLYRQGVLLYRNGQRSGRGRSSLAKNSSIAQEDEPALYQNNESRGLRNRYNRDGMGFITQQFP